MPDVTSVHVVSLIKRHLEREDAEDFSCKPSHCPNPTPPPRPELWRDIKNDWYVEPPETRCKAKVEVWRIHQYRHCRSATLGLDHQSTHDLPYTREFAQHLYQAHVGKLVGRCHQVETCSRQPFPSDSEGADLRTVLLEFGEHVACMDVSRDLPSDHHQVSHTHPLPPVGLGPVTK
jgi:hypothetical protein